MKINTSLSSNRHMMCLIHALLNLWSLRMPEYKLRKGFKMKQLKKKWKERKRRKWQPGLQSSKTKNTYQEFSHFLSKGIPLSSKVQMDRNKWQTTFNVVPQWMERRVAMACLSLWKLWLHFTCAYFTLWLTMKCSYY